MTRRTIITVRPMPTDPDVEIGGFLVMERADGRSLWRQRFRVVQKADHYYKLQPCDEFGKDV